MTHRAKLFGALGLGACFVALTLRASADLPPEEVGQVLRLPDTVSDHWLWVPDRVFRHSILLDGDSGKMLGAVDSTNHAEAAAVGAHAQRNFQRRHDLLTRPSRRTA